MKNVTLVGYAAEMPKSGAVLERWRNGFSSNSREEERRTRSGKSSA